MLKRKEQEQNKMIKFFKVSAGKTPDTITMEEAGISKIRKILDPMESDDREEFPIAELRGLTNGNVDIAVCNRASDGEIVKMAIPKGQRFTANF